MEGDLTQVRQHPRVLLDFFTQDGLERLTGMQRSEFVRFIVKELVDNSLDKPNTRKIGIEITSAGDETTVSVSDDGSPSFTYRDLEKVLDFTRAPSSKRGLKRVSRGILGNALQSCFGISYVTWESFRRPVYTAEVHGDGIYQVHLDHDSEKPTSTYQIASTERQPMTKFVFRLQGASAMYTSPKDDIENIVLLNQHARFDFSRNGNTDSWPAVVNEPPHTIPPDIRAYSFSEFRQLLTEGTGVSVANLVREFRGLKGTLVAKDVREEAGIDERVEVSQLSDAQARSLFDAMRRRARETRSGALPRVGRDALENYGFERYACKTGVYDNGEVKIPFVVEAAARKGDYPNLIECINFTSSLVTPFSGYLYSKQGSESKMMRLTDLLREKNLTAVVHLVCPAIRWRNPAKGQLDIVPFREEVVKALRSVSRFLTEYRIQEADIVSAVAEIMDEHSEMDFTIRQLFYRMVVTREYPNSRSSYSRFSKALVEGRLEGDIDYERIIDMSRPEYFNDPEEENPMRELRQRVEDLVNDFNVNAWNEQPVYPEVWIEKEALSRVILPTCKNYNVNLIVGRGYSSYTQISKALDRFPEDKKVRILYLGDHDPSGLHIQDKLMSRLEEYARSRHKAVDVEVRRMALTYDQTQKLQLPPSKMKKLGQQSSAYLKSYGSDVWELDALEPAYLLKLVEDAIVESMDKKKWKANRERFENFKRTWAKRLRAALG